MLTLASGNEYYSHWHLSTIRILTYMVGRKSWVIAK